MVPVDEMTEGEQLPVLGERREVVGGMTEGK